MGNDNHSCLSGWPHKPPVRQELNSWANIPCIVLHEVFLLLDHNDRINASSTCHNWRQALYHPSFWNDVHFVLDLSAKMQKSRFLISACSHLVKNAKINYTSLSSTCVKELSNLLEQMTDNYNVRSLMLEPSHCRIHEPDEEFIEHCIIQPLLKICPRLEKFSLGCSEELCENIPRFLDTLYKNSHPEYLHTLSLASVKDDPGNYIIIDIDHTLFTAFKNLKILSLDYDYVNDNLLESLRGMRGLTRLIIHVHGLWEGHPGTTEKAWSTFKMQHPECELRLTLIHAYEAVQDLQDRILHPSMPLSHLKVFFCEDLNVDVLHLMSSWYVSTLRSIIWVDSQTSNSVWSLVQLVRRNIPDPLVMAAWVCSKLEEIVLLGYKYFEEDLVAIARLRGDVLKKIEVADEDIIYSHEVYRALPDSKEELSKIFGYPWSPLSAEKVHPVIKDPTAGDSDDYLLPIVLADLN